MWQDDGNLTAEMTQVILALKRALNGRRPNPIFLEGLIGRPLDLIPGHRTLVEHQPHSPKGVRPRLKSLYKISITGPRVDGRWAITPGQLEKLFAKLEDGRLNDPATGL